MRMQPERPRFLKTRSSRLRRRNETSYPGIIRCQLGQQPAREEMMLRGAISPRETHHQAGFIEWIPERHTYQERGISAVPQTPRTTQEIESIAFLIENVDLVPSKMCDTCPCDRTSTMSNIRIRFLLFLYLFPIANAMLKRYRIGDDDKTSWRTILQRTGTTALLYRKPRSTHETSHLQATNCAMKSADPTPACSLFASRATNLNHAQHLRKNPKRPAYL